MALPHIVDRRLRKLLKYVPPRCILPSQYPFLLLFLLLVLLFLNPFLRRSRPITLRTAAHDESPGTSLITPCTPHPCQDELYPSQVINLLITLTRTEYVVISTTCTNTTTSLADLQQHVYNLTSRFFTTTNAIILRRSSFLKADGFDERYAQPCIPALVMLLTARGLRHTPLSERSAVSHICDSLPVDPSQLGTTQKHTEYEQVSSDPLSVTIVSAPRLHNISQEAVATARRRALHDVHDLPYALANRVSSVECARLVDLLDAGCKILLIHVAHGLGNRLRALGSSLAFATATRRVPILVWPIDAHCSVGFDRLFEKGELIVIEEYPGYPFRQTGFNDIAYRKWDYYNYMPGEDGAKDERIADSDKHIYYKGAYVMRSPLTSWNRANEHLRALTPVRQIRERVEKLSERLSRSVGVHVRHLTTFNDIGGVDPVGEYGDFDARVIGYFRSACSPQVFISELRKVLPLTELTEVFVAADDPRWRSEIAAEINGVWGNEGCEGRCEIDALVDLLSLARCPTVLGSFWSSFSEAVQRFSGRKVLLAGVDFGHGEDRFGSDVQLFADQIVRKRRDVRK